MKSISINNKLNGILSDFRIGVLSFKAEVFKNAQLDKLIKSIEEHIRQSHSLQSVLTIPYIYSARNAYKKLGKDPSRYRLAVESLFRRIVKGNSLYPINNIVDAGNLLSLKTTRSIAVLDEDKIHGDITIRIGKNELYEGINRGTLNIENIPVYCDEIGPFGTPTSDTFRTAITENTKNVLLFIISFDGINGLFQDMELGQEIYINYCNAKDFQHMII